jgi:hypothetical protein
MKAELEAKKRAYRLNASLTNANFFKTPQAYRTRGFRSAGGVPSYNNTEAYRFE